MFTIEAMKSLPATSWQDAFDALLTCGVASLALILVCGSTWLLACLLYKSGFRAYRIR